MVKKQFVFGDKMTDDFLHDKYITGEDRRFFKEINEGVKPYCETLTSNNSEPQKVPEKTFDISKGFFDYQTGIVYSYD